jgi:hypothetical protein
VLSRYLALAFHNPWYYAAAAGTQPLAGLVLILFIASSATATRPSCGSAFRPDQPTPAAFSASTCGGANETLPLNHLRVHPRHRPVQAFKCCSTEAIDALYRRLSRGSYRCVPSKRTARRHLHGKRHPQRCPVKLVIQSCRCPEQISAACRERGKNGMLLLSFCPPYVNRS